MGFLSGILRQLELQRFEPCLYVGGNYSQNGNHGMFYVNYNTATNTNANIGCLYPLKV